MALRTVLRYAALGIGLLVLLGVGIAALFALIGVVWGLLKTLAVLLVGLAVVYAAVRGALWLWGAGDGDSDDGATEESDPRSEDSLDRLTQQYVDGKLSEAALERRLELELDGPDRDEIDRELERSR